MCGCIQLYAHERRGVGGFPKLLITGAFSTGKTTLVRALAASFVGERAAPCVLDDVARSCPFPLNEDQTWEASCWLVTEQIRREIEAYAGAPSLVICDRGIPDILSHHKLVAPRDVLPPLDEALVALCREWVSTYEFVLVSRIDERIAISVDEVRTPDPKYRRRLQDHLIEILRELRVDFVELPFALTDRVAETRRLIKDKMPGRFSS